MSIRKKKIRKNKRKEKKHKQKRLNNYPIEIEINTNWKIIDRNIANELWLKINLLKLNVIFLFFSLNALISIGQQQTLLHSLFILRK